MHHCDKLNSKDVPARFLCPDYSNLGAAVEGL